MALEGGRPLAGQEKLRPFLMQVIFLFLRLQTGFLFFAFKLKFAPRSEEVELDLLEMSLMLAEASLPAAPVLSEERYQNTLRSGAAVPADLEPPKGLIEAGVRILWSHFPSFLWRTWYASLFLDSVFG